MAGKTEALLKERTRFWPINVRGFPAPRSRWIGYKEAFRVAIGWDMPYSYEELVKKAREGDPLILERLFTRAETVDWLKRTIDSEAIGRYYERYKDIIPEVLKREIEVFVLKTLKT